MLSPPQWLWFPLEFTEYLCLYLKDSPSPFKDVSVAGEIVVGTWFATRKKSAWIPYPLSPFIMLEGGRQIFMGKALVFLYNKKLQSGGWQSPPTSQEK